MSFFSIIETLVIGPLKLIFEIVFDYGYSFFQNPGLAIIFLSLIMNLLVLPLYRRADAIQRDVRDREAKIQDGIVHIKKTFSGDERMMILQTFYRQNHYRPTDALKGSLSLLLEIPFFIAAYQFLSHLSILDGVPLGPIRDLGEPDGLLVLGGVTINLLPVIMTVINLISGAIYLKGFNMKAKLQLYLMAVLFLVVLYQSPACLVFYWTLNNVFSLLKNICYKLKLSEKLNLSKIILGIIGMGYLAFLAYESYVYYSDSFIGRLLLIFVGVLPLLLITLLKGKVSIHEQEDEIRVNSRLFAFGSIFLTLLTGLLIPSVYISASPQEYVNINSFYHPLWYVVSALCLAIGTFLIWMRVFYSLADTKGKVFFSSLVWIMCSLMFVNYMFFGTKLGIITSALRYEKGMAFSAGQQILNLLILGLGLILMYFFVHKWKKVAITILGISIIVFSVMGFLNLVAIKKSISQISSQTDEEARNPEMIDIPLSKTGHNVIVIMLDRALGEYIPYIFNEKPELEEQFAGFTYYENTISFGGHTVFASPSLFGGYEYTPVEMNKRNTELMFVKQNEALKVMPVIFLENGYEVTVCDPVFANYQWIPDLSIYNDYPEMHTYITEGLFDVDGHLKSSIENNKRNFFCFSMMKTMPLLFQSTIYDDGRYHQITSDFSRTTQLLDGMSVAVGLDTSFMDSYNVLANLENMTEITEDETDTFLVLSNNITHQPMLLQAPDYTPSERVDNTTYDAEHSDRFIIGDRELKMENGTQIIHYHANMAAMLQLGQWFDYMRENDIYNNTRIILVSDHGYNIDQLEELEGVEFYYPLLMVKDFDSEEFVTSHDFMTNADVPSLAMKDIIINPENPFTGKPINGDEKYAHDQFIILSHNYGSDQTSKTFVPSSWASVKDDLWNRDNWTFFDEEIILDEHAIP